LLKIKRGATLKPAIVCRQQISRSVHRNLMVGLATVAVAVPLGIKPASASGCINAGVGTFVVSGNAFVNPATLDPPKRYCLSSRTDVIFQAGTIPPNGVLDVYTGQTFAPSFVIDSYHLNSILLSGTSIAAAPNPGTPFLRTHPLPIADSIGAIRVNLVGVDIGENRSIELTKASGIKQIQDVYIVSAQPRTYQSFSISNPNLVAIGAYNIIGQTFVQPTDLTLKQSAITNAKVLGIEKGSTLKLDASTIDTEFVRLDGTLAGNGTIRGAAGAGSSVSFFTRSGSVLSPGLSIGTLNIEGSLGVQGATSLISEIDPNAAQKADLLSVTGALTGANNLTVTLEKDSGFSASGAGEISDFTGSTYTVLTAASIDSDAVTLVEGGSLNAHLSARLIGQPSATGQVVVGFTDNSATPGHVPSKLPASTPWSTLASAIAATHHNTVVNGIAGGGTAPGGTGSGSGGQQRLSNGQTVSTAWLGLTNAQVGQLDQVHAEPYSSNLTVGLEQLEHIASSVMARMSADDGSNARDDGLWMDVSHIRGRVDGKNGLGDFGYSLSNLLVGADLIEHERFSAGVYGGYAHKTMHEHDKVSQDFSGQSAVAGVYGFAEIDQFVLSMTAGYAHGWHTSKRFNPNVGLFTGGVASAAFTSRSAFASSQLGYRIEIDDTTRLEPFVTGSYSRIWQSGLAESGGHDFNYRIAKAHAEALTGGVGVNFSTDLSTTATGRDLMLVAFLRYDHDFEAAKTTAHQVSATSHLFGTFTQAGQNRGAHSVTGGLGLSGSLTARTAIRAGVTASRNQNGHEIGGGAHLKVKF
jgi:hypothetical protein